MLSVEEIEFADIQNMEYPLTRNENKNICNSYSYEPYSLTVVFCGVCLDGNVLIADRKLTNTTGGKDDAGIKIHGDLEHILMGYTGAVKMFDIFRKYVVGDVIITRADE
jgi:hypothetical protein